MFKPILLAATLGLAFVCSVTCVMFRGAGSQLEGSRRFHAGSDALQQREECVPIVCAVDVGCVGLQQLMKPISHLSADPGQHMRFHHEEEAQREENLDARHTRDTRSETEKCQTTRSRDSSAGHVPKDEWLISFLIGLDKWNTFSVKMSCVFIWKHDPSPVHEVQSADRV